MHTAPGQYNEARHWPVYTRDGTLRGEYRPASGVGAGPNDQYYYLGTQLIARRRGAADVSWFLTNHIGSNVATTDAFGNEIEDSRFAPYGERHAKVLERGPAYAGHFEDATGITYMKARYYSGFMGVFLAIDPVDVDPATGGNFNRYAYANNNPFRFVDPDGRNAVAFIGGLVTESWNAVNGRGFDGSMVAGALADGYNGEGDGFARALVQDATALVPVAAGLRVIQGLKAVANVVKGSSGSIRAAAQLINKAGLSQSQAVRAMKSVVQGSGREVGAVVKADGGAKIMTGVQVGRSQPIVHVAQDGTTTMGTANVTLAREGTKDVFRVKNVVLRGQ